MKNIITIGASTSSNSINKQLAFYTAHQLQNTNTVLVDISNYNSIPIYSVDYETQHGAPKEIVDLHKKFTQADGFIISFAEHNGSYVAGYKNVIDWISRQGQKVFNQKPMLLLSTSPGGRGGITVLTTALSSYSHLGAEITGFFSLPSFNSNFKDGKLTNQDLQKQLQIEIDKFQAKL